MSVNTRAILRAVVCGVPVLAGVGGTSARAASVSYTIPAGTTVNWQGVNWTSGTTVSPSIYSQPQPVDDALIRGVGTVMYLDAAATIKSLYISRYLGDTGVALELRSGAKLTTDNCYMGYSGWAVVNMNGGTWTVTAGNGLDVGQAAATGGTSMLNMHGGTLSTPTLNVAYFGSGTLNHDGGLISATSTVALGGMNEYGRVAHYNLSGAGTLQTNLLDFKYQNSDLSQAFSMTGGTLQTPKIQYGASYNQPDAVFIQDDGTLAPISITGTTFSDIGTLTFANAYSNWKVGYAMGSKARLALQLASDTSYDKLVMNGDFTAGGTLDVTLAGYTPRVGDTFTLFSGVRGYQGNFSLIKLPAGATWDTSSLLTNGTISVSAIPEPISAALLGLGGLAVLRRPRRSR